MKFLVALAFVYASEISALIQTNILSNIIKGADELFKKSIDYVGFDPILHEDALLDVVSIFNKENNFDFNVLLCFEASYNNKVWLSFRKSYCGN